MGSSRCGWSVSVLVGCALLAPACGDDAGESASSGGGTSTTTAGVTGPGTSSGGTSGSASNGAGGDGVGGAGPASGSGAGGDGAGGAGNGSGGVGGGGGGAAIACDYQSLGGMLVMEAEDLALLDSWEAQSDAEGYTGSGYRLWVGASQNGNPGQGLVSVALHIPEAGRYRLQWRNRIGMGTDPTEHNDTWLRFADADAFYGLRVEGGLESRRYPKPLCEDQGAMAQVLAEAEVSSAQCPNGATSDGWLKVYSSGADDWRWSTRTSDNDAHDIYVEFARPGVYAMEISARGDHHLIDRIVLHDESLGDPVVQELATAPTPCR